MGGFFVECVEDYLRSEIIWIVIGKMEVIYLLIVDVIKCYFEDGLWFCLCLFGIELKIKFYFSICGESKEESVIKLEKVKVDLM